MSTDLHTLSGAYAVDALSEEEARSFEKHLEQCEACRQEVRELQEAAARLGASESQQPPASLKDRVLAAADQQPQLPPKVTSLEARRRRPWLTRVAAAAAAVVVVAGGAFGIAQLGGDDDEAPLASGVSQVFTAQDHHEAKVSTKYGEVRVATSPSRNEMAVDARDLKPLDAGKVYQVWSIQGTRHDPVVVLGGDVRGASMAMPSKGTTVAITVEPAGGSKQPTTEPIVTVDPASV
jgi:anti-sigma-K factor RskA